MPIDQTMLGTVVQEQMEAIERDHHEDECQLGAVMVIVEILCAQGEPNEGGQREARREIRMRTSPMTPHGRVGLLTEALRSAVG